MNLLTCHLILDNIRSLHNVGSIFRTADSFGIQKIWLCGITGKPPHREIQKTALGATESVDWEYRPSTLEVIKLLKSETFQIVGLEQTESSQILQQVKPTFPLALILGHEVQGVSAEVLLHCDACWEIPQLGKKQSMNVSVTAGMTMFHLSLFRG